MRAFRIATVVAGSVAFAPGGAGAGEVTEAEFLARLTDDHPAVVALGGEKAAALGEQRRARTDNPTVSLEREAPDGAPGQSTVKLGWRPPLDGRRGLAREAAGMGLAAAERRLSWARLQLREELRALFARWSLVTDRRDLYAGLTERVRGLAARSRARASTGEESGLSAGRLDLAAAEARSALAAAEAEVLLVRGRVTTVFPDLGSEARPVRPPLPSAPPAVAATERPDLEARKLDVERAELDRRQAGRYFEFPSLIAGWTVFDEDDADISGPVFGLEWSLPVFDRRQGQRIAAAAEAEVARARLSLARSRAAAELDAALEVYTRLRAAALAVRETMHGAEAVIEAATAEFQAGESTLTDLLEILRSTTDARLAELALHQEALTAHRRLELGAGRPLIEGGP